MYVSIKRYSGSEAKKSQYLQDVEDSAKKERKLNFGKIIFPKGFNHSTLTEVKCRIDLQFLGF